MAGTPPSVDPAANVPEAAATPPAGPGITPFFAPIPFKNSQLGWGLAGMAGIIHRFDPDTTFKPSTGAVGGFYTENKSWGVLAVEAARLNQDRWRLLGLAMYTDVHYDFFGIGEDAGDAGVSVPVDQKLALAMVSGLRRWASGFYAGPAFLWIRSDVALDDAPEFPEAPAAEDLKRIDLLAPGSRRSSIRATTTTGRAMDRMRSPAPRSSPRAWAARGNSSATWWDGAGSARSGPSASSSRPTSTRRSRRATCRSGRSPRSARACTDCAVTRRAATATRW
jgi:hypothetical protein